MDVETPTPAQDNPISVWKVIGMFALLFLAVQLAVALLDTGINTFMSALGASQNLRVFLGSTLSRAGMIAAALFLTKPVITSVLRQPGQQRLFPFTPGWGWHLFTGMGISALAMSLVFLLELALGWLSVSGLALAGLPWDAVLRALWMALLVNLTAAVVEETLFRGFLISGLTDAWDKTGAVFISAVIFGGSHILVVAARQSNWLEFIPLLALPGIMLGWAYLRTGNLWLATGLNFAWNFFQDEVFNLPAREGSQTLVGLLTRSSGPQWFMGASFGIEVGAAGVLALVIACLGIWAVTRTPSHLAGQD